MAAIDLGIADLGNIIWFEKCWDFAQPISSSLGLQIWTTLVTGLQSYFVCPVSYWNVFWEYIFAYFRWFLFTYTLALVVVISVGIYRNLPLMWGTAFYPWFISCGEYFLHAACWRKVDLHLCRNNYCVTRKQVLISVTITKQIIYVCIHIIYILQ